MDDSVAEDVLLDIRDYLAEEAEREDKVERKNDELLASVSPADFRTKVEQMAKVSMHQKKSQYSGRVSGKGKSVHWHKSVYANQDDDTAGFLPAVEEEAKDMQDERLQGSDFLVSNFINVDHIRTSVRGNIAPLISSQETEEIEVVQNNLNSQEIAMDIKESKKDK